jgi:hypothetical protein
VTATASFGYFNVSGLDNGTVLVAAGPPDATTPDASVPLTPEQKLSILSGVLGAALILAFCGGLFVLFGLPRVKRRRKEQALARSKAAAAAAGRARIAAARGEGAQLAAMVQSLKAGGYGAGKGAITRGGQAVGGSAAGGSGVAETPLFSVQRATKAAGSGVKGLGSAPTATREGEVFAQVNLLRHAQQRTGRASQAAGPLPPKGRDDADAGAVADGGAGAGSLDADGVVDAAALEPMTISVARPPLTRPRATPRTSLRPTAALPLLLPGEAEAGAEDRRPPAPASRGPSHAMVSVMPPLAEGGSPAFAGAAGQQQPLFAHSNPLHPRASMISAAAGSSGGAVKAVTAPAVPFGRPSVSELPAFLRPAPAAPVEPAPGSRPQSRRIGVPPSEPPSPASAGPRALPPRLSVVEAGLTLSSDAALTLSNPMHSPPAPTSTASAAVASRRASICLVPMQPASGGAAARPRQRGIGLLPGRRSVPRASRPAAAVAPAAADGDDAGHPHVADTPRAASSDEGGEEDDDEVVDEGEDDSAAEDGPVTDDAASLSDASPGAVASAGSRRAAPAATAIYGPSATVRAAKRQYRRAPRSTPAQATPAAPVPLELPRDGTLVTERVARETIALRHVPEVRGDDAFTQQRKQRLASYAHPQRPGGDGASSDAAAARPGKQGSLVGGVGGAAGPAAAAALSAAGAAQSDGLPRSRRTSTTRASRGPDGRSAPSAFPASADAGDAAAEAAAALPAYSFTAVVGRTKTRVRKDRGTRKLTEGDDAAALGLPLARSAGAGAGHTTA